MTCEDLRKVSNLSRGVLLESVQGSGDKETDLSLFAATMKEVEKGFIKGPIDKDELPVGSTLTKRFPVAFWMGSGSLSSEDGPFARRSFPSRLVLGSV